MALSPDCLLQLKIIFYCFDTNRLLCVQVLENGLLWLRLHLNQIVSQVYIDAPEWEQWCLDSVTLTDIIKWLKWVVVLDLVTLPALNHLPKRICILLHTKQNWGTKVQNKTWLVNLQCVCPYLEEQCDIGYWPGFLPSWRPPLLCTWSFGEHLLIFIEAVFSLNTAKNNTFSDKLNIDSFHWWL